MYKKLKTAMYASDVDQALVAKWIKRSHTYVTLRMTGRKPWTVDDAYLILSKLGIDESEITEYFPRGGVPKEWRKLKD